ncbi:hypothetical protein NC652_039185 [Populus alba x Populus x berolinensis]|nr:hypothetical protein NC652_039185 [Populus alba x Populus x berolinensis]
MLIGFGNVNGWNPMHDHNSPGHKCENRLMFMLEVEETEEERGDQELSLADITDVGLEEYFGELCRISLNARFGGAQYRTVKTDLANNLSKKTLSNWAVLWHNAKSATCIQAYPILRFLSHKLLMWGMHGLLDPKLYYEEL